MSSITLLIADDNEYYAKGLSEYISEEYKQTFEVGCFTNEAALTQQLEKSPQWDVLLINPKLLIQGEVAHHAKLLLELRDDIAQQTDSNEVTIYRNQTGDQIVKQIMKAYGKVNSNMKAVNRAKEAKLLCTFSSRGGAGKTVIAYNLAYQYALQGQQVLFLSMESCSALQMFDQAESKQGIVYLMHLIKSKAPSLQAKFEALKCKDITTNISYLPREHNILELKDVSLEDVEQLLTYLRMQSGLDVIILDLDSCINEIVLGAFKTCDAVLNIHNNDMASLKKAKEFEKQILKLGLYLNIDLPQKMIHIQNKVEPQGDDPTQANPETIEIPYIRNDMFRQSALFPEMQYFMKAMVKIDCTLGR